MKVEGDRRLRVKNARRTQPTTAGFEDGGRGHEPRNAGGLQELEKTRKQIPPLEAPERRQPSPVKLLNYRTVTQYISVVLSHYIYGYLLQPQNTSTVGY